MSRAGPHSDGRAPACPCLPVSGRPSFSAAPGRAGRGRYVTGRGALSGIVALQCARTERLVFVPRVPQRQPESHLRLPVAAMDAAARSRSRRSSTACRGRPHRLGPVQGRAALDGAGGGTVRCLSRPHRTRTSSQRRHYVEVLALVTLALALATQWVREPAQRGPLAVALGLALASFWCHILAVIPLRRGVFRC